MLKVSKKMTVMLKMSLNLVSLPLHSQMAEWSWGRHFHTFAIFSPHWPWFGAIFCWNMGKLYSSSYGVSKGFFAARAFAIYTKMHASAEWIKISSPEVKCCVKLREPEIKSVENISSKFSSVTYLDFLHARTIHDGTSNIKVSGKIIW